MTQITHLIGNYWAVEVPDNLRSIGLGIAAMYKGLNYLVYDTNRSPNWDIKIELPKGKWQFLFLSSQQQYQVLLKMYLWIQLFGVRIKSQF